MLDLYLIRHGEAEHNRDTSIIGGRAHHSPLTSLGVAQAQRLGKRLAAHKVSFDTLYTSPTVRTVETARIVARELGIDEEELVLIEEAAELSHGEWEGRVRAEVFTEERNDAFEMHGYEMRAPGGESVKDVEERFFGWILDALVARSRDEDLRVAVFTHGTAIRIILRAISEGHHMRVFKDWIENTGIVHLAHDARGWHVLRVNDYAHLE